MQISIVMIFFVKFNMILNNVCGSTIYLTFNDNGKGGEGPIPGSQGVVRSYKYYVDKNSIETGINIQLYSENVNGTLIPILLKIPNIPTTSFTYDFGRLREPSNANYKIKEEANDLIYLNNISKQIAPLLYLCGKTFDGRAFMVMEYFKHTLHDMLKSRLSLGIMNRLLIFDHLLFITANLNANNISYNILTPHNIGYFPNTGFKIVHINSLSKSNSNFNNRFFNCSEEVMSMLGIPMMPNTSLDIYSLGLMFWNIENNYRYPKLLNHVCTSKNKLMVFVDKISMIINTNIDSVMNNKNNSYFAVFEAVFLNVMHRVLGSMVNYKISQRPTAKMLSDTFYKLKTLYRFVDNMNQKPLSVEEKKYMDNAIEKLASLSINSVKNTYMLSNTEIAQLDIRYWYKPKSENRQKNLPKKNVMYYVPLKSSRIRVI